MTFSVAAVSRSRSFRGVIALFAAGNAWSWLRYKIDPVCCDQEMTVGFPFPFHISGGIAGLESFYVLGLLLDIILALTLAVLATWIASALKNLR
jgi:hypothetical protein